MKKCPKCGTILDDSKKKCYMCGADLTTSSTSVKDFSSNFDSNIGGTISSGSDNIFNNGKDIDVDSKDIVDPNNNGSFFSHSSQSKDYFHSEISKLNDIEQKEVKDTKKKKGGLFGKKKKKEEKQVKKITYSTNPKVPQEMEQSIIEKQLDEMKKMQAPKEDEKKQENVIKSSIVEERNEQERNESVPDQFKNFNTFLDEDKETGKKESIFSKKKDNISDDKIESAFSMFNNEPKKTTKDDKISYYDKDSDTVQNDFSKLKEKKEKSSISFVDKLKSKIDIRRKDPGEVKELGRMIFNMSCLVVFIILMVVVYFKFLKVETKEELSGLQFTVPSYFKLSSTQNDYRFYVSESMDKDCAVKVSTGPAADPDDFTERWFSSLKSTFEKEQGAVVTRSEMKLNGNKWESQKIVFLPTDGTEKEASDILPRYVYSLFFYNTTFYTVQFNNIKEDNECNLQYDKFMNSLEFVEKNVR